MPPVYISIIHYFLLKSIFLKVKTKVCSTSELLDLEVLKKISICSIFYDTLQMKKKNIGSEKTEPVSMALGWSSSDKDCWVTIFITNLLCSFK